MKYTTLIGEFRIKELQKALGSNTWPEFMQHDQIVNKYWHLLYTDFLDFQFAFIYKDETVGIGNSIPLNWQRSLKELPDSGLDWAIEKASTDFKYGSNTNLLIGLQILINKKYQGRGISFDMLQIMKNIARANGIDNVALPVRPTLKSKYPLIQIDDYISWLNKDGLPYDPWLRVHIKAGGKIVGICKRSMDISGSVSEWEKWAKSEFPGTGDYVLDGALIPVSINKEEDTGRYVEPNVWIIHNLKESV